jgi:hypothetical protein
VVRALLAQFRGVAVAADEEAVVGEKVTVRRRSVDWQAAERPRRDRSRKAS